MIRSFIVIASLAASTAMAAPQAQLSDVQYLAAARCRALIASPALGKGDTHAIDGVLKAQNRGRPAYIYDKGQDMQQDAASQARHASPTQKTALIAERDGVCQAFNGAETMTAGAAAGAPTAN